MIIHYTVFLLVQSIDKTYRHIDTDTLINVAIEYYKHTPDSSLLSKIYYCAGRVYEEMENYPKSIYYYISVPLKWDELNN